MAPLVPLILFLLAATVAGETPRIAVLDMTRVFKAHPDTKRAEAALAEKRAAARKEVDVKANELKAVLQKHQEVTTRLVAAGASADESLKAEAEKLLERAAELEREVAALQTTRQRDLKQEFLAERRRILDRIAEAVESHNSEGAYALVLDLSAASENGIPQVIHAPGADDITMEILAAVSAKQEE